MNPQWRIGTTLMRQIVDQRLIFDTSLEKLYRNG